jgi:hypothetical protein
VPRRRVQIRLQGDSNATIAARESFCAASVVRFQSLTSLAGCAFGLLAVRRLEQGAMLFKHKPCKFIMRVFRSSEYQGFTKNRDVGNA